jgi:hypothetical protein
VFIQQWDGKDWKSRFQIRSRLTRLLSACSEKAAAEDYLADKPEWKTQTCS